MTYQLARLRLISIGDRAARFTDVTIDLTSSSADDLGDPTDTILWLRNGGGKSSLLSLFFALLLPNRNDFMGKAVKRYLEDYVASGDTSHVVAEWVAEHKDGRLPQRLVTGAVHEWIDRRKPLDPDRDRDKLKTSYYTFFVVPGALDLERLPVDDELSRRRRKTDYLSCLKEITAPRAQEYLYTPVETQSQWRDTLIKRDLDPALFGYQKQMNHSEGGVAELFNFPSTDKFIDFLIDLTIDRTQPELVADNLAKVGEVLGRKPDLLIDRDFCSVMADRLEILADRHSRARSAHSRAGAVRLAAARLAGAFRSSAAGKTSARERLVAESQRLSGESSSLDSERSKRNDAAHELWRVAANYRHITARAAVENAETEATATKSESRAWEAVEPLAEQIDAEREADSVRAQLVEEEKQTEPLRSARDRAAAALKARYRTLACEESETAQAESEAADEARSSAETEAATAETNRGRATEAAVRAESVRGQVIEIDEAVMAAVGRGDLDDPKASPLEALAGAIEESRAAGEELGAVRERRGARPAARSALVERAERIAKKQLAKESERDLVHAERAKLIGRVDALATNARLGELRELGADSRLNLWSEVGDLRVALTHAMAEAEAEIIDTRVDAADDDRALEGLRTEEFLPGTRDAQRAVDRLTAEGVRAQPGWKLLRDLVPESDRDQVLKNPHVAGLASGVVIADGDAATARASLATLDFATVAHVSVSTATQLQEVLGSAGPEWLVLASDRALFDPLAAENARTEREVRRQRQDERIVALKEQAVADRALLLALENLLQDCPAGHLETLEKLIESADEAIVKYQTAAQTIVAEVDELARREEADASREQELSERSIVLAGRIERLEALAPKVHELPALRARIGQLEKDQADETAAAKAAAARAAEFRKAVAAIEKRAAQHGANHARYVQDLEGITFIDSAADTAEQENPADLLSVLRGSYKDLDLQWRTTAAQSVLAERLTSQVDRAQRAHQRLGEYELPVRERAAELLATSDGQDIARRGDARTRARDTADVALQVLSSMKSELELARLEVEERATRGRPRPVQLDVEPADEAEARQLAEGEAAQATEMSARATNLAKEAEELRTAGVEAASEAAVFQQQANRLQDAANPADAVDDAPPYEGTAAETELAETLTNLRSAVEAAQAQQSEVDRAVGTVRRVAAENRFVKIPDAIRDRFAGDDAEVLSDRAAGRAEDLRLRRATIDGQLQDITRDQSLVVVELAALVREALKVLESAHRHSKLPGTLGGWANEHFLRIKFTHPSSEDDLQARIDAVVDRVVAENSKPAGLALLKRCVHEAVAPRGFTVKVLKPSTDRVPEAVDVTHLGKFSGGEKLTVCVALYCTLARLRAVNRGRRSGVLGGTLVLDNPLGTASHVALLRLQRDVAAAHGVQLVYTTGVEDFGAVGQFPNVLRMRNSPGALRARRYVVVEDRIGEPDEGITGVRVNRSGDGKEQ
ncbi:hypothetical protein E1263_12965 [Kribbella antibiotica]|uniref:Chromosome segregation ATPase n=1 Tax=Kribbella antibiotica TaxID=190195 RepID=A0A4R4ZSL8_9ACTN|nr:hypothetical protein [Kribbella antibiotica]TDD60002.1 hypothetical protein E1263_12965 [Kribbella antibiotica]